MSGLIWLKLKRPDLKSLKFRKLIQDRILICLGTGNFYTNETLPDYSISGGWCIVGTEAGVRIINGQLINSLLLMMCHKSSINSISVVVPISHPSYTSLVLSRSTHPSRHFCKLSAPTAGLFSCPSNRRLLNCAVDEWMTGLYDS